MLHALHGGPKMRALTIACVTLLFLGVAACNSQSPPYAPPVEPPVVAPQPSPEIAPAPPSAADLALDAYTSKPEWLDQGWTDRDRKFYYKFSQGSQIMPLSWFLGLERADGTERFLADGLARFGYLPRLKLKKNPDALPVGFMKDSDRNGDWIGMSCAACHTNRVVHGGHVYQIDGAPGGGDLSAFIGALADSMDATLADTAKFERFYLATRAKHAKPQTRAQLRAELSAKAATFRKFVEDSRPDTPWGPARTDAFGMIFNRVTSIDLNIPQNSRHPTAPVSMPFLWTTNIQDKVQWNAGVDNASFSRTASYALRLARNVGQVLGVFGKIPGLHDAASWKRYGMLNTVRFSDLGRADAEIEKLKPPPWIGPPVAEADFLKGRELFEKRCALCHVDVRDPQAMSKWPCPTWPAQPPRLMPGIFRVCPMLVSKVGTDSLTADNIDRYTADTGVLKGYTPLGIALPKLGANEKASTILGSVVVGAILTPWHLPAIPDPDATPTPVSQSSPAGVSTALKTTATGKDLFERKAENCENAPCYKGGPLNGIWATAPYLHNGSVPTLDDLLKPVAERPVTFEIGSRVLDVDKVGFVSAPGTGRFVYDTTKPGNSNAGHLYGANLSADERRALVQYLKTL